jgi:hypothetical protein
MTFRCRVGRFSATSLMAAASRLRAFIGYPASLLAFAHCWLSGGGYCNRDLRVVYCRCLQARVGVTLLLQAIEASTI